MLQEPEPAQGKAQAEPLARAQGLPQSLQTGRALALQGG